MPNPLFDLPKILWQKKFLGQLNNWENKRHKWSFDRVSSRAPPRRHNTKHSKIRLFITLPLCFLKYHTYWSCSENACLIFWHWRTNRKNREIFYRLNPFFYQGDMVANWYYIIKCWATAYDDWRFWKSEIMLSRWTFRVSQNFIIPCTCQVWGKGENRGVKKSKRKNVKMDHSVSFCRADCQTVYATVYTLLGV